MGPAPTFVRDPALVPPLTPVIVQGGTLFVTLVTDTTGIPVFVAGGSVSFNLSPGNINIGSVELKDADSENRAFINPANQLVDGSVNVLYVQHVDPLGKPLLQSTQTDIDLNTANTALILLDIDGTLTQVQGDTAAIRMSGTRIENAILNGNSTLSVIQTDVANVPVDQAAIRISGTRIEGLLNADAITQSAIRISGTRVETAVLAGNAVLSSIQTNTTNIPTDQAAIRISGTRVETAILAGNSTLSTIQTNTANIPSDENAIRMSGTRVEGVLNTIASYGTRVTLYGGPDGNPIGSSPSITGDSHLGVAIIQDVFSSVKNSSTANLIASGTFVGLADNTLGVSTIQVSLKTDQNCNVFIEQSPDGVNWDISDTFTYYAAKNGDSWNADAVCAFCRIRVTNLNSLAPTSFLRLQALLVPEANPLPRTLTQNGNLQVSVEELLPTFVGNSVKSSPEGSLRICETVRLVGVSFYGSTPDTNFWTTTLTGSNASTPISNQQATLSTGTASNGAVRMQSVRVARFIAGATPNFFRSFVRNPASTGANTRRWGPFSLADGFFYELNSGVLSVVTRKASVDNKIASGSFNGLWGTSYVLDTNVHIFEIYWTPETTWFFIDDVLLHKIAGQNTPLAGSLDLPVGKECNNTGGNFNSNTLEIRAATISRLGPYTTQPILKNINSNVSTVLKVGPGVLHKVILNNLGAQGHKTAIYDNTAVNDGGNGLAIWGTLATGLQGGGAAMQGFGEWTFEAPFFTGLTLQTGGATAADISVVYE